jgi:hypothetical protein
MRCGLAREELESLTLIPVIVVMVIVVMVIICRSRCRRECAEQQA